MARSALNALCPDHGRSSRDGHARVAIQSGDQALPLRASNRVVARAINNEVVRADILRPADSQLALLLPRQALGTERGRAAHSEHH